MGDLILQQDTQGWEVGQICIQDLCSSSFNPYVDLEDNLLADAVAYLTNVFFVGELSGGELHLQVLSCSVV